MIQDYRAGKYWASIVLEMLKKARATSAFVRAKWIVYGHIMIWFLPLKATVKNLFRTYQLGMKIGDFNNSMYPLVLATSYALFEGENLSLLSQTCVENLKMMVSTILTNSFYFLFKACNFIDRSCHVSIRLNTTRHVPNLQLLTKS